ncbi:MAG: hypothetical protein H6636_00175 [Anaerolineales bacterium]|nr:hypothetical protein [Anaerolineales bacterium]
MAIQVTREGKRGQILLNIHQTPNVVNQRITSVNRCHFNGETPKSGAVNTNVQAENGRSYA